MFHDMWLYLIKKHFKSKEKKKFWVLGRRQTKPEVSKDVEDRLVRRLSPLSRWEMIVAQTRWWWEGVKLKPTGILGELDMRCEIKRKVKVTSRFLIWATMWKVVPLTEMERYTSRKVHQAQLCSITSSYIGTPAVTTTLVKKYKLSWQVWLGG